jgi:hypothetical protein
MIQHLDDSRFEDRLLAELKRVVAARAMDAAPGARAPRHQPVRRAAVRRKLAIAGPFALVGAAVPVAYALTPGAGTPAYAVSTNRDGTVTVAANYLGDPAEANHELRRAGVRAIVLPAVPAASCPAQDRGTKVPAADGGQGNTIVATQVGASKRVQVRWRPDSIRPGTLLVLSPQRYGATGELVITIDHYYQPGPRCVAMGVSMNAPVPVPSINSYDPNPPVVTASPDAATPRPPSASPAMPTAAQSALSDVGR